MPRQLLCWSNRCAPETGASPSVPPPPPPHVQHLKSAAILHPLRLQPADKAAKGSFKGKRTTSWGTLAEASGQQHDRLPVAPRFTARQAVEQAPLLSLADFPAAVGGAAAPHVGSKQAQWAPAKPYASLRDQQRQQAPRLLPVASPSPASPAAERQLLEEHAWAGRELVAAVLAAMHGDAAAAAAALADMVADGGREGASSAGATRTGQAAAAAAAISPSQSTLDEEDGSSEDQQDPYFRHRRRALQLSRRWARAARGAGAAYAAGEHSAARQLAAEAQRLRREALAAHAEAAERIEEENNRDKRWVRCGMVTACGKIWQAAICTDLSLPAHVYSFASFSALRGSNHILPSLPVPNQPSTRLRHSSWPRPPAPPPPHHTHHQQQQRHRPVHPPTLPPTPTPQPAQPAGAGPARPARRRGSGRAAAPPRPPPLPAGRPRHSRRAGRPPRPAGGGGPRRAQQRRRGQHTAGGGEPPAGVGPAVQPAPGGARRAPAGTGGAEPRCGSWVANALWLPETVLSALLSPAVRTLTDIDVCMSATDTVVKNKARTAH